MFELVSPQFLVWTWHLSAFIHILDPIRLIEQRAEIMYSLQNNQQLFGEDQPHSDDWKQRNSEQSLTYAVPLHFHPNSYFMFQSATMQQHCIYRGGDYYIGEFKENMKNGEGTYYIKLWIG